MKNGVTLCLRKKFFIFISALCHLWLKLVGKFWKRIYLKVDNTFSLFFFFMESLLYMVIQVAGSASYSTFVVSHWPVHTFKQVYCMVLLFHKKENAHFSFLYFKKNPNNLDTKHGMYKHRGKISDNNCISWYEENNVNFTSVFDLIRVSDRCKQIPNPGRWLAKTRKKKKIEYDLSFGIGTCRL